MDALHGECFVAVPSSFEKPWKPSQSLGKTRKERGGGRENLVYGLLRVEFLNFFRQHTKFQPAQPCTSGHRKAIVGFAIANQSERAFVSLEL